MLCPFSPGAPEHFEFWRGKTSKGAHLSEVFGEGAKRPSEAGVGSRLGVKMSEVKMSEVIMSEVKNVRGKNVRGKNISGKNVRGNNVRGKHVRGNNVRGKNVRGKNVRGNIRYENCRGIRVRVF